MDFPRDEIRFSNICQLADYLLNVKERSGFTPEMAKRHLYFLIEQLPYEPELIHSLETKVGGADNLVYLCAAAECGSRGREGMLELMQEFDSLLVPGSYEIDFEGLYRVAREKKAVPQKKENVLRFPGY